MLGNSSKDASEEIRLGRQYFARAPFFNGHQNKSVLVVATRSGSEMFIHRAGVDEQQ